MYKLLTRDEFREGVFKRDSNKCVVCGETACDAHHLLERRLWPDGGYYLENGVSLCGKHHMEAEETKLTPEHLRYCAKINKIIVPPHLYDDHEYDKWGNHVLPNGQRCKGELFYDESVQKVLAPVLHLFTDYIKYPRTFHLPWSPGIHDDDRALTYDQCSNQFMGRNILVTEKMDGENTSLYTNYMHARSIDSGGHESRDWIKNWHRQFAHDIPEGWRVNVENMYAEHSIKYNNLESYAYGFAVWDRNNTCLSWSDTKEWFELFGITSVPVLYEGLWDEAFIRSLCGRDYNSSEGYVIRLADSFSYGDFKKSVAKYVREGHVQTNKHWMHGQRVVKNGLKES